VCQISFDECTAVNNRPSEYGNGIIDPGEECDIGVTSTCSELGFSGGTVICQNGILNTSGCVADVPTDACRNEYLNSGESCEVYAPTCVNLGISSAHRASCFDCDINTDSCYTAQQVCGNNVWESGEECDGTDRQSCGDIGFTGGVTACNVNCTLDTRSCSGGGACVQSVTVSSEDPLPYPHIEAYCLALEDTVCSADQLLEGVEYNPACYWEGHNYCVRVMYGAGKFEGVPGHIQGEPTTVGVFVCTTLLAGGNTWDRIVVPFVSTLWDIVTKNYILFLLLILISFIFIMYWYSSRR